MSNTEWHNDQCVGDANTAAAEKEHGDFRRAIESGLGVEHDAVNHGPEWAEAVVLELREIANKDTVARKYHHDVVSHQRKEIDRLKAEVDAWKDACGLERGGDPDGVTPANAKEYWENIERIAQQRDDAVNSYLDVSSHLEELKIYTHMSSAYICSFVRNELRLEADAIGVDNDTRKRLLAEAEGAAACADRLRSSTPDGWPGRSICWTHSNDGGDLPRMEARPTHRKRPHLSVQMRKSVSGGPHFACVEIVHSEDTDDFEHCCAEFDVPFRDDLPTCSCCNGHMIVFGAAGPHTCPWCYGEGVSVMDEAMKLANWVYSQWLVTQAVRRVEG